MRRVLAVAVPVVLIAESPATGRALAEQREYLVLDLPAETSARELDDLLAQEPGWLCFEKPEAAP